MRPTSAGREDVGRYKPYPAYKASGVEWLGAIPANWGMKRLKYITAVNPTAWGVRGLAPETEVSFVPMEAVGEYGGLDLSRTRRLADVGTGYTCFRDGDVVVAKITPCFENGKGAHASGLVNGIGFGTTELHVLRAAAAVDRQFLFYLTLSTAFRQLGEAEMYGAGGQKRVPEFFVENLRHPLPPIWEQRAIAAFLDGETARIDALVGKNERLIHLLQEKRAALITRAVTKGLPSTGSGQATSNVPMKDSGVQWLGEMPAHWEVKRLRWVLEDRPRNGISPPIGPIGETPTFSIAAVRDDIIRIENHIKYTSLSEQEARPFLVRKGDVLLLRGNGNRGFVGRAGIVVDEPPEGCVYPDILIRTPPKAMLTPWFLVSALNSVLRPQIEAAAETSAGIWKISGDDVRNLVLSFPPLDEQVRIGEETERASHQTELLIRRAMTACDHLRELRTALISAAVTGKIDVRSATGGAAANEGGGS